MSYPPGSPGYPPAQQPTTQFSAPTQQFGKVPDGANNDTAAGPSKLPFYLLIAVAVLGVLAFIANLFSVFKLNIPTEYEGIPGLGSGSGTSEGMTLAVAAALLAGLLAAVSLVPRQRKLTAVTAAVATLGFLLVIANIVQKPDNLEYGWAAWAILALTLLQAAASIAALLYDSGVITPPAPKPKYDQQQQQYGQYGAPGGYYGQPQHPGQPQQQLPQQRPGGYPTQYGGGYPGQQPTGGFSAQGQQGGQQSGPPTPPTGFPTYGQPQQQSGQAPGQQQSPSSQQSGPAPS